MTRCTNDMDALRELGARTGYLVDILTEDDNTLARQLSEAGVIILGDGPRRDVLRDALAGTALRSIEEAFDRGATLYAVGCGGLRCRPDDGPLLQSTGWRSPSSCRIIPARRRHECATG
jgi:hypothetical protein